MIKPAGIYRELGEEDNTASYQKALEATRKYGSVRQEANLHTSIGIWYHSKRKYREAINQYKESIQIGQKVNLSAGDIAIYEGNLATTNLHH